MKEGVEKRMWVIKEKIDSEQKSIAYREWESETRERERDTKKREKMKKEDRDSQTEWEKEKSKKAKNGEWMYKKSETYKKRTCIFVIYFAAS